jgi:hypothetical protein
VTRDEALKIMQETTEGMYSYERLTAGTYLDGFAEGKTAGYEQGVRDSANRLPFLRRYICTCSSDVCPRVAAVQDKILALLDAKEKKG